MKTLRKTTTKAPAASKASKRAVKVENFTVTERWVKVTATIREDHYPQFRQEADPDLAPAYLLSVYMAYLCIATRASKEKGSRTEGLYDISMDAWKWGYNRLGTLTLKNSTEITFRVKESEWLEFIANCEFIGHPPEAVIRGAFGARATGAGRPGCRLNAQKVDGS